MYNKVCYSERILSFRAPPVSLLPEARYDEVMAAFGGRGFLARTAKELRDALQLSLDDWERPSLINVLIDPSSDRKQQVYEPSVIISIRHSSYLNGNPQFSFCPSKVFTLEFFFLTKRPQTLIYFIEILWD